MLNEISIEEIHLQLYIPTQRVKELDERRMTGEFLEK